MRRSIPQKSDTKIIMTSLERNNVKLHPLDPIFVTNFNPDPNTIKLVWFVLKGFRIELFSNYSEKIKEKQLNFDLRITKI